MSERRMPADDGLFMPAEWEPHRATWLSWPHNLDTWPGKFEPIPDVWTRLVELLAPHEEVNILAAGDAARQASERVGHLANVVLHDLPTNDCWMRDHGPTFLKSNRGEPPVLVDWGYNAWGGKYPPFDEDNRVPERLAQRLGRRRFEPGIILEGGSIDINGQGSVLVTEQCLLNPNRNPQLSREQIEQYLADYLACRHVLWLGEGIVGDDTDGHIDDIARFVGPRTVVAVVETDPAEENFHLLQDNLRRLQSMTDQDGRPLEVETLPMPRPMFHDGQRLPASYANFYIANRLVVVPVFGQPADDEALSTLAKLFPDREVVGQYALDLVWGLGAYHCITQQEPL